MSNAIGSSRESNPSPARGTARPITKHMYGDHEYVQLDVIRPSNKSSMLFTKANARTVFLMLFRLPTVKINLFQMLSTYFWLTQYFDIILRGKNLFLVGLKNSVNPKI